MEKMYFASRAEIENFFEVYTDDGKLLGKKWTDANETMHAAENAVLRYEEDNDAEAPDEMYTKMFDAQKNCKIAFCEFMTAFQKWAAENDEYIEMID